MSNCCCPPNNDDDELDKLHKRGTPLWVFRLMRFLLCLCPLDVWIAFPILVLCGVCAVGIVIALNDQDESDLVLYIVLGVLGALLLFAWLHWARRNPQVPQGNDVFTGRVSDPSTWPKAPVAPTRSELTSKGGCWFRDEHARRILFRGVNLAGGCKLPMEPPQARQTHLKDPNFYNYKNVSFVGRPFPLHEANVHLGRLRAMGYTLLRFLITWEAVEHDGPGIYDEEYLNYLQKVIRKCAEHGISVFVDAHQDVWSRWTGGDGAPAWTLEKVGFQMDKSLDDSAAALTQQNWDTTSQGAFPKMVWNSNNSRLAAGTMWTLFFAGNDFAPHTQIDQVPVQDFLQGRFCAFLAKVAETLKDEPNVVGFDILNEPSVGFLNIQDMRDIGPNLFYVGWRVDPWQAIQLGAGQTVEVDYFSSFMVIDGKRTLNPNGVCAWRDGPTSCVWHENRVWEMRNGQPHLLRPKYFATNPNTGKPINVLDDYALPFWHKAAAAIRQHMPDAIMFAEPVLDMCDPSLKEEPELTQQEVGAGYVWARHNYDGITLMTKSFNRYLGLDPVTQKPSIGMQAIERTYGKSIASFKQDASKMGPGGCPVLVGECGIPFDLHDRKKVNGRNTHDFTKCTQALNTTMRAMEHAKVSYTIWCYEPDNTNEHGDGWNGEDLSLFSKDQVVPGDQDNLFAGGRSLLAAIRPYPCRVAGDILDHAFYLYSKDRKFRLVFRPDHSLTTSETIVFLPKYHYPRGVEVTIKQGDGTYTVDWETQTLSFVHSDTSTVCKLVVRKVLLDSKKAAREQPQPASETDPEESTRLVVEQTV